MKCKVLSLELTMSLKRLKHVKGLNSRVPDTTFHYPLFDCDNPTSLNALRKWINRRYGEYPVTSYRTPNGFHVILWMPSSFGHCCYILGDACEHGFSDRTHFALGVKRGYWFLQSYDTKVSPPKGLECRYMRIERT